MGEAGYSIIVKCICIYLRKMDLQRGVWKLPVRWECDTGAVQRSFRENYRVIDCVKWQRK